MSQVTKIFISKTVLLSLVLSEAKVKLPLCGLNWESLSNLALPGEISPCAQTLTFGRCSSVPWHLGGAKHATGIVIPELKCWFCFSDILRGLFSLHCQLHLAPVHGPQGEIQPEPLQGAPPGEWDSCGTGVKAGNSGTRTRTQENPPCIAG